jgi:hypothetical protein
VDRDSATLQGHNSFGLGLDRFNLNMFLNPSDGHFEIVRDVIQNMVAASAWIMKGRGHCKYF